MSDERGRLRWAIEDGKVGRQLEPRPFEILRSLGLDEHKLTRSIVGKLRASVGVRCELGRGSAFEVALVGDEVDRARIRAAVEKFRDAIDASTPFRSIDRITALALEHLGDFLERIVFFYAEHRLSARFYRDG